MIFFYISVIQNTAVCSFATYKYNIIFNIEWFSGVEFINIHIYSLMYLYSTSYILVVQDEAARITFKKKSQDSSMCYHAFYEIMHISAIAASVCKSKCIASRCIHAKVACTNFQLHPHLVSIISLNISVMMLTAAVFVFYQNLLLWRTDERGAVTLILCLK